MHQQMSTSATQPMTIGSQSSQFSTSRRDPMPSIWGPTCSFPSWPSGDSLSSTARYSAPSSYISDEDLFPEAFDDPDCCPFLLEPPAPPREVAPVAMPLPPLYASEKSKKKRRTSRKQTSPPKKPMAPIAESAKTPE